jgi:AMP deaminase
LTDAELLILEGKDKNFQRLGINELEDELLDHPRLRTERQTACRSLLDLIELRAKYQFNGPTFNPNPKLASESRDFARFSDLTAEDVSFRMIDGIITLCDNSDILDLGLIPHKEFFSDLSLVVLISHDAMHVSVARKRLKLLGQKFDLHKEFNCERELLEMRLVPKLDFYNLPKVNNLLQLSGCMSAQSFLTYIQHKVEVDANRRVFREGTHMLTLSEVFGVVGINPDNLTVASLDVQMHGEVKGRFDLFDAKYNPLGLPMLRNIFLKKDNFIKGQYLAEMSQQVIANLEKSGSQFAEFRVSIYGNSRREWKLLAKWFKRHHLASQSVTWLIQLPRMYSVQHKAGLVSSFEELLSNIFGPLFEASLDPAGFPDLNAFLENVVGLDLLDTHIREALKLTCDTLPSSWITDNEPPYSYWSYFLYANLFHLNCLRKARGLNTFAFRMHSGEVLSENQLSTAYLLAYSVNHGLRLNFNKVVQYLFYLTQIHVTMSPIFESKVFLDHSSSHPFHKFFRRGLNLSISTANPLLAHLTNEPFLEEISVLMQVQNLNPADIAELMHNAVLASGFPYTTKENWLGQAFNRELADANEILKTKVPSARYTYRFETLHTELEYLNVHSSQA